MSILNRLTAGHLDDAALAEIWTAQTAGSTEVIPDAHLADCAECRVRFSAFAGWMEELRTSARTEADEAFPAERLLAQQAQILRRLETAERPARVIAFPKYPVNATGQPSRVPRWVGVGVAAGLMIGLGLGQIINLRQYSEGMRPASFATNSAGDVVPASDTVIDPELVDEIDAASAPPRYEALRAFDTATPRAADFVTSSR